MGFPIIISHFKPNGFKYWHNLINKINLLNCFFYILSFPYMHGIKLIFSRNLPIFLLWEKEWYSSGIRVDLCCQTSLEKNPHLITTRSGHWVVNVVSAENMRHYSKSTVTLQSVLPTITKDLYYFFVILMNTYTWDGAEYCPIKKELI